MRGDGGYIVAPPSRHRSGRLYEWEASNHPDEIPLSTPPAWLAPAWPDAGQPAESPPASVPDDAIPEGRRNDTLTSLAGTMRWRGMTSEEIHPALAAVNARRRVSG